MTCVRSALRFPRSSLILLSAAVLVAQVAAAPSGESHAARIWTIPDSYWKGAPAPAFPEAQREQKPTDLGVAFSGGGTRSAAATLGQLRGLRENGWLARVGYISAVSGGSWAAVPFTFADRGGDPRLLGPQRPFASLVEEEMAATLDGSLADAIASAKLLTCATLEASRSLGLLSRRLVKTIGASVNRCDYGDADAGTYSRLLWSIFIRKTLALDRNALLAWDEEQLREILEVNPNLTRSRFVLPGRGRPFLIVNATVIRNGARGRDLLPIEMTPYYTGVRRSHASVGGIYTWSWAFDSEGPVAAYPNGEFVRLSTVVGHRGLSLGDMMASSGAAPLLALLTRLPDRAADRMASYFPHFTHFAVREGLPGPPARALLHGDGGFLDNLGVMPLLARKVRNILVFVNAKDPLARNDDLKSYFRPISTSGQSGSKAGNVVFADEHYDEIVRELRRNVREGRGAVACGSCWEVLPNATYNIQAYGGLNICFAYNYHSDGWWHQLPDRLRAKVARPRESVLLGEDVLEEGECDFRRFPWYDTFFENKPTMVFLKPAQVHLLAHLSCWTLQDQKKYIEDKLASVLR